MNTGFRLNGIKLITNITKEPYDSWHDWAARNSEQITQMEENREAMFVFASAQAASSPSPFKLGTFLQVGFCGGRVLEFQILSVVEQPNGTVNITVRKVSTSSR